MVSTTDKTEKLGITLPKPIIEKVDTVRGDVPRSAFIRRAVEGYLVKRGAGIK